RRLRASHRRSASADRVPKRGEALAHLAGFRKRPATLKGGDRKVSRPSLILFSSSGNITKTANPPRTPEEELHIFQRVPSWRLRRPGGSCHCWAIRAQHRSRRRHHSTLSTPPI